jgi:hypothetical protein
MATPIDPILDCMGISGGIALPTVGFEFPSLTAPGFPTLAWGGISASFAGVNYALDFLPPDPLNLPSLPTIDLFKIAFEGAAIGLPTFTGPPFFLGLGGLNYEIPGVSLPNLTLDALSINLMIELMITLPFELTLELVTSIINLSLEVPGLPQIKGLFISLGLSIGLDLPTLTIMADCFCTGVAEVFSVLG